MRCRNLVYLLFAFIAGNCLAQSQPEFRYKRKISGIEKAGWYILPLPSDIFENIANDFKDLRLYSTSDSDTLELPYLLEVRHDEVTTEIIQLPLFNASTNDGVLYLTFELNIAQKVNHIDLRFQELNYFGYVAIEGSNDQREWFEVVKGRRIVSIKNGVTDYVLSGVDFPLADYRYLRASVSADVPVTLKAASFQLNKINKGVYNDIPLRWKMQTDKKSGISFVDVTFSDYVPVSSVLVETDTVGDYYRSVVVQYLRDSAKTEKGWVRYYEPLYQGHVTSFSPNEFNFEWQMAREIRLVIRNNDNSPLPVTNISASGPEVQLISYLEPGENFLFHGAEGVRSPSYDLAHFENKIPADLMSGKIGRAEMLSTEGPRTQPLFENKLWLWGLMAAMITGLGFFTIKMMKART